MLAAKEAMATIAVKDLAKAKKFYGDTLGLKQSGEEMDEVATYSSGKSTIVVYESQFAGTNKATSATWGVGDELDSIVSTLKKKGVPFEHYDMPGRRSMATSTNSAISAPHGSRTPTATSFTSTANNCRPPYGRRDRCRHPSLHP